MQLNHKITAMTDGSNLSNTGCGLITFWRISGNVGFAKLCTEWALAGLNHDELPELPTPAAALREAVYEHRSARTLVRPTKKQSWVVKSESLTDDATDTMYSTDLRVELTDGGMLFIEPQWHPLAEKVRNDFNMNLREIPGQVASGWMVALVNRCMGISLKDTGGVYFIPPSQRSKWNRYAKAIEAATKIAVYDVPAMRSDDALRAVSAALSAEANEVIEKMDAELAAGDMGVRALEWRRRQCIEAGAKIQNYASLLGGSINMLTTKLQDLEHKVVLATLVAQEEKDAK